MLYAKVTGSVVLKFPYTLGTLQEENPNSLFDNRYSLTEWFSETESAVSENATLVEVTEGPTPSFTYATQKLVRDDVPSLIGDSWQIVWHAVNKTQEELDSFVEPLA